MQHQQISPEILLFKAKSPQRSSCDLPFRTEHRGLNTPWCSTEDTTHIRRIQWSEKSQMYEDKALPPALQSHYQTMLQAGMSSPSKLYKPYRASYPQTSTEGPSSDPRYTRHLNNNVSKASSPRLHLNNRSKPTVPLHIDVSKALPPIKISESIPQKPVTPSVRPSAGSSHTPPSIEISPPISPVSSSSTTPTLSPKSLSSPTPPSPISPKPKYGDERFQTLPDEPYPWIDTPPRTPKKIDTSDPVELPGTHLVRLASVVKEQERPFWRAKIEPIIDPRSGTNYYERPRRLTRVRTAYASH